MINIAICDDDTWDLQKTYTMLGHYLKSHDLEANVATFSCPELLLETKIAFDVYLLDMIMPEFTGIEVGKILRERGEKGYIVYLTSSVDYAIDAFSVNATHYILKPYSDQQFDDALERVFTLILSKPKQIGIKTITGEIFNLNIEDISYAESQSHILTVHANGKTVDSRRTLVSFMEELDEVCPGQFLSPYKGYTVNLDAIFSVNKYNVVLKCEKIIPITRRNFKAFQEAYMEFLFGEK